MRVTNTQKTQLKTIITELGLSENYFDFTGRDEIFQVKFKDDFFTFHITMYELGKFQNKITYVDNKNPRTLRLDWADTTSQFKHWAKGIADDLKHSPKKIEKVDIDFPVEIHKYSKSFVEIYKQALTAEKIGLTEICGIGYRKSYEFLIKDYLLRKNPKNLHNKIKEMQITPCINEYVTDDEIKLVAYRVLWLGNDQAHYLKKWKGKTLADLKSLIDLTIKWILIKDELVKAEKSMPNWK